MSDQASHQPGHGHGPPTVTVKVFAPSSVAPKTFTWPQTKKVGEAASEAAAAFGVSPEAPTFQKGDEVLDRNKPLVAAGVRDGDTLELVSAGGGVYLVAHSVTLAAVESEIGPMIAYGLRHGWDVTWVPEDLKVICRGRHPADESPACLVAEVGEYRAMPPAWRTYNAKDPAPGALKCPAVGPMPEGIASLFGPGVICAPFNRLAYKDHGGPHQEWGGPAAWLSVRNTVHAITLGDMLAVITGHLHTSPGWSK